MKRKDQLFVHKLFDALKEAGRDAWVDWEGIPSTAEWLTEVYGAIDGADTFVFILSPDSVSSKVCGEEAAHAVANGSLDLVRCKPINCPSILRFSLPAVPRLWLQQACAIALGVAPVRGYNVSVPEDLS